MSAEPNYEPAARVATSVLVTTSARLYAAPMFLCMLSSFDELGLDDDAINDIAEACANELDANIPMPVACETLGDLGKLLLRAVEERI